MKRTVSKKGVNMKISVSLRDLVMEFGQEEGFDTPQKAIFAAERFSTRDKKKFYLSGGSWLIPNEDESEFEFKKSEMDDESKEKLMPLIIKAATGYGYEVEFR
jgi:hypothetical protein